ncbi:MAG: ester cyclase [Proteobacteria bacterium]|nr:ester cyclase [Pseudomonadota bacterium]
MQHIDRSFRGEGDLSKLTGAGRERRQDMRGFDEDYTDIVDYIVRSTHKIWEGGGMGLLYTHYQHNAKIHTPYGMEYGREAWLAASISALSAYPDYRLYADDVIWSGNENDGFYSSHRILGMGTNLGYSLYGPPTGRKIKRWVIATCYVKENRIVEEWVVRDESALVRQLGYDPVDVARKLVERERMRDIGPESIPVGDVKRLDGQNSPKIMPQPQSEGFDPDYFVRNALHEIWNWRLFNKIGEYYTENHECNTAGGRKLYGLGDYQAFVMAMLTMFPDAHLLIDHVYANGNDADGYRVAVRWHLLGTHEGPGIYGEPTGRRINIMGASQLWVDNGNIYREWTIFDEIAILKQIHS